MTTFLGREIGQCPACQSVYVREAVSEMNRHLVCEACGTVVGLHPVRGEVGQGRSCDARCTGAVGPLCNCACEGANHGSDYL